MKFSTATLPSFALVLGISAASAIAFTGGTAVAQTATAPAAATVPPAATPAVPQAASTASVPPELPASGTKPRKSHGQETSHASRGMSGYLAALHQELKITPAEEPLWTTFATSMKDSAAQLGEAYRQRREQLPTMNALADMNSFIGLEQMRLDGLKKSSSAFAALYQTMPADQQKVADTIFLSDMPGAPHHKKPKSKG